MPAGTREWAAWEGLEDLGARASRAESAHPHALPTQGCNGKEEPAGEGWPGLQTEASKSGR